MIKTVGNYTVEVDIDYSGDSCCNPREDDNLGLMICFHDGYDLGDKNNYDSDRYQGWDEMEEDIMKNEGDALILPLYLYDHSGITMSTSPFSCTWNSGQVGFIVVSKQKLREEYSVKYVTQKTREIALKVLKGEVETYDQYLRGEIYRCVVKDENGEYVDSINGYYDKDDCMSEGVGIAEYNIEQEK